MAAGSVNSTPYTHSNASRLTPTMAAMNSRKRNVVSEGKAKGFSRIGATWPA